MAFPSLVGGTLVPEDLAPSIIYAILFGSLVISAAYRLFAKSSRTTLLIGTTVFSIERVVIFSFRAVQSRNQAKADSHSLATYEQLTIGMGYISISQDLVNFLRVLLVNTTHPEAMDDDNLKSAMDLPRERARYRQRTGLLNLAFLAAIVPGIIGNSSYSQGIDHPDVAKRVMNLRYASSGVALLLIMTVGVTAFVASRKIQRVEPRPALILMSLSFLLSVVAIYRLSVMHNTTDSLLSREPSSLSSPSAKALFYIFHTLPEWLASATLLTLNVRTIFRSGPFGDWRKNDKETSWELRKRKKQEKSEREEAERMNGKQKTDIGPLIV